MSNTNRNTLKISYSTYIKNPSRQSAHYYGRVREKGQAVMDVDLKTREKSVAEAWARLRKSEVERYNEYVLCGEQVPEELESRIVRYGRQAKTEPEPSITIRKSIDIWEADMRVRGMSERTITMYCKSVGYVLGDIKLPITSLTVEKVRSAVASQSHIQASTRHSYFVAFVEYLKFVSRRYGTPAALLDEVPKVKVVHKDQPWWTITEIRRIIEHVKCKTEDMTKCYKAYYWFLALTGARQNEASLVEWSDIKDGYVTFRSTNVKTGVSRTVPLEWRLLDMINHLPRKSKYVFADLNKSQAGRFAVLSRAVRRCGAKWGGLHSFRRSCSMYMYEHADDVKAVADMLGHGSVTMMRYYVASRSKRELSDMVNRVYMDEIQIPDAMDRLVEDGLI